MSPWVLSTSPILLFHYTFINNVQTIGPLFFMLNSRYMIMHDLVNLNLIHIN